MQIKFYFPRIGSSSFLIFIVFFLFDLFPTQNLDGKQHVGQLYCNHQTQENISHMSNIAEWKKQPCKDDLGEANHSWATHH